MPNKNENENEKKNEDVKIDINIKKIFDNKTDILKEIEKSIQHQNILFDEKVFIKITFTLNIKY